MSDTPDYLILVDEDDNPIGFEEKLQAHMDGGKLHRAFSVFIFNAAGELLLQQRSRGKYHFGGRWSNTCCSHPLRGEDDVATAARSRLMHEMGLDVELRPVFTFTYRATDPASGLTEHEYDHVLIGRAEGAPRPDPSEVSAARWVSLDALQRELDTSPGRFTPWLSIALDKLTARGLWPT
jgi:isopentenyl-diphosphate delta-isomerase